MVRIFRLKCGAARTAALRALCALLLGGSLGAQTETRIDAMDQRLEQLQAEWQAEHELLEFEIEGLGEELARMRAAAAQGSSRSNAFNPEITVFGNTLARLDDRKVFLDDDAALGRLDDRFQFREVEVDFRAAIDPFADGVVIASFGSELPGEYEVGLEEAYVDFKRLPFVDAAPLGLKLRIGRFRPEFGRFNQVHLHDLPQSSYPRALAEFLGPEGYVQEGIAARVFLPSGSPKNSLEANLQWLSGGDLPVAEDQGGSKLAGLGHLKFFRELSAESTVEVGSSLWRSDSDHSLFGLDATYKWKPLAQGQSKSFLLGGELFRASVPNGPGAGGPLGYFVWTQYQFSSQFYLGLRWDHSQDLADSDLRTRSVGLFATYYTSEFLRTRLGYEHTESDIGLLDGLDSILFELNFIIGSHPSEPYWVSR